jgi:hypothetical protein
VSARGPGFFIVGAPKCGTTWLHALLSTHPDAFLPSAKEPHHFNTDSGCRDYPERAAYEALFAAAPAGARALGEASVRYLWSRDAAANIRAYNPDARCIVLLRDPVEMAPAVHAQEVFNGNEDEADFARAWSLADARWRGEAVPRHCPDPRMLHYGYVCANGAHLARWLEAFPPAQVLPLLLDDVRARPQAEFARVLDFLGLAPWTPPSYAPVNEAKERRSPWLRRLVLEGGRMKRALGIDASLGVLRRLNRWNVRRAPRAPLPDALRAELRAYFAADVARLETLLGRDLTAWKAA